MALPEKKPEQTLKKPSKGKDSINYLKDSRNDNPKLTTCDHRILTTLIVILLLRVKILSTVFALIYFLLFLSARLCFKR